MTLNPLQSDVSRRTALVAGLAGAGTLALAACSSSGNSDANSPLSTLKAPAGTTDADGGQDESSAAATTSAPAGSGSSAAGGGDVLTSLDAITVGEAVSATLSDGSKVLVSRPTATTAACFSAICTHQGCTVAPAGKILKCPCHGSEYNALTGAVIQGPAPKPLPAVTVSVVGGKVVAQS